MLTVQIAAIVKPDAQWHLDKIALFVYRNCAFFAAFFLNEREKKLFDAQLNLTLREEPEEERPLKSREMYLSSGYNGYLKHTNCA